MAGPEIERLIQLLSRLPGLGPRSAKRIALHLVERRESILPQLVMVLGDIGEKIRRCPICGNYDSIEPCAICSDRRRDRHSVCVVEDVGALWAMERTGSFQGRYHVLGGLLSALDGTGPDELGIPALRERVETQQIQEVILATPATVDGQTTAHCIADHLAGLDCVVSGLAQGVPMGGDLDHLDDGTIAAALRARRRF